MNKITLPLPEHMSFELRHNPHKADYYSISEYLDIYVGEGATWASDDQRQKALDTNELWEATWHPATPIGSCMLVACDLSALLAVLENEA